MTPVFSIIICVYNSEKILKRNIYYVLNQTFRQFEVILVNDGSTDTTLDICNELSEKYNFIKIFNQENKGPGIARNVGIANAVGQYVCFFDIDDHVNDNWLNILCSKISDKPEVLIYGYREINEFFKSSIEFKFPDLEFTSNKQIGDNFTNYLSGFKFNNGFVWNKIYRRDFLVSNNLKFPENKIQGDEIFNHEVYRRASHIKLISFVLYDYFVYDMGNVRNQYIPNRVDIFDSVKKSFLNLVDVWGLTDKALNRYIRKRHLYNILYNKNKTRTLSDFMTFLKSIKESKEVNESLEYMYPHFRKGNTSFFNLQCKFLYRANYAGFALCHVSEILLRNLFRQIRPSVRTIKRICE